MPPDLALDVRQLGKRYALGHAARPGYRTLRDALTAAVRRRPPAEPFWAVRDISFRLPRGEKLGVVGRNGAGKSTLLKLLARITPPTEGEADVFGRVGSLLEVGAGFHQELTGRENVFLNGVILGMSRREVGRRFDEIVQFAEVEKFLDTPVKHYSSGMYTRLAFAVAAHLQPDVLIVDEVLAVGDAAFQKKCLGKMDEVARGGRTVLFVSHNMPAVQRLCTSGLVLDAGRVAFHGPLNQAVAAYLGSLAAEGGDSQRYTLTPGTGPFRLTAVRTGWATGGPLRLNEPFEVTVEYEADAPQAGVVFGVDVLTREQLPLFSTHSDDLGAGWDVAAGPGAARVRVDPNHLAPGEYTLSVAAWTAHGVLASAPAAARLTVAEVVARDGQKHFGGRPGNWYVPLDWDRPQ